MTLHTYMKDLNFQNMTLHTYMKDLEDVEAFLACIHKQI